MSITPTELLAFAKTLSAGPDVEAIQRAAASRAYYAAYQHQKPRHPNLKKPRKGGMHYQFINALQTHDDPQITAIGDTLNQLYKLRIRADYKVSQDFTQQQALDATTLAQQLIATPQ